MPTPMRLAEPGLAFTVPIKGGHLVGLVTHAEPDRGSLCWIAAPTFEHEPSVAEVAAITEWRWPVWFLARTAIRRRLARSVGVVDIPVALRAFPKMRSGSAQMGWIAFTREDGESRSYGPTTDWELPIGMMVNHTTLQEMVERDWHQKDHT